MFISEDYIKSMISRKASRKLKYNFPENKGKNNSSQTVFHETNTKKLEDFWSITNQNMFLKLTYRS